MSGNKESQIRLSGVRRRYTMGDNVVRALDGVDLEIGKGEFVVIMGSSGSGKSTMLNILGCLDTPSAGTYELGGQDVSSMPDEYLSRTRNRNIGFVFQQFNLLPNLTVLENIALPLAYRGFSRDARLDTARHYAEMLGLGDRTDHHPSELSGGQSQRVAIARALVTEPEIILADEPTGNLDSATGKEIFDVLRDLNRRGYTIILVTHDPKYADTGTRRITLGDGRIIEDCAGELAVADPAVRDSSAVTAGGGMSLWDLARVSLREGLFPHKMRTALTMLGIVIGVAGVIAMSSFSLGSKKKQADQIRALGANLVRVVDNRLEGEKLSKTRMEGSQGLSVSDIDLIRKAVPGVRLAAGSREIKLNIVSDAELPARILGVAGDYLDVNNLKVIAGRGLDETDSLNCARVAVIGGAIARKLGYDNPVGRFLLMGGNFYRIVGVLSERSIDMKGLEASGVADANYDILLPLKSVLTRTKRLEMRSELDEIHLQLESEDMLYDSGIALRRVIALEHGGNEDFRLVIPLNLLRQKQQAQRLLDILTACISSIALLVGGIGIMNIMLASVTERIREIGIRRAVGATRRDIKFQFLSESMIISVIGGIVGILAALAGVIVTCAAIDLPVVVSPLMVLLSVAASTLTGLAFGIYPATKAAARDPVEALHYE